MFIVTFFFFVVVVISVLVAMLLSAGALPKVGPRRAALVALGLTFALLLSGGAATNPSLAAPAAQTPPPLSTPTKPILLTDGVPDPKQEGVQYFSQTGHTLRGSFLTYWQQYGGLAQFGYPLTEEFFEPVGTDNKPVQVQYFERNRFELHPENAGSPYEVLLGTLSREFHPQDPPAQRLSDPAASYFPETGHNLSGKFLEYWHTHGGIAINGYPITEAQIERSTNGKEYLVQWFERSRMELHPENAGSPYEMLLGVLGRQLSEKKGYPYGWYPLYGRATDYSWIAGKMQVYSFGPCIPEECGCIIFQYEQRGYTLQINMTAVQLSRQFQYDLARGASAVIFGRRATPVEDSQFQRCYRYRIDRPPGYFARMIEPNPSS